MIKAKIVYASMTGNTEEIADYVKTCLEESKVLVNIEHCDDFTNDSFVNTDICIVATYTYGDGELPEEMNHVFEKISKSNLNKKVFGVCGSGDTFYEEYCKSVDDFERVFLQSGALKGTNAVKVDTNIEEEDKMNLKVFANGLIEHLLS